MDGVILGEVMRYILFVAVYLVSCELSNNSNEIQSIDDIGDEEFLGEQNHMSLDSDPCKKVVYFQHIDSDKCVSGNTCDGPQGINTDLVGFYEKVDACTSSVVQVHKKYEKKCKKDDKLCVDKSVIKNFCSKPKKPNNCVHATFFCEYDYKDDEQDLYDIVLEEPFDNDVVSCNIENFIQRRYCDSDINYLTDNQITYEMLLNNTKCKVDVIEVEEDDVIELDDNDWE